MFHSDVKALGTPHFVSLFAFSQAMPQPLPPTRIHIGHGQFEFFFLGSKKCTLAQLMAREGLCNTTTHTI